MNIAKHPSKINRRGLLAALPVSVGTGLVACRAPEAPVQEPPTPDWCKKLIALIDDLENQPGWQTSAVAWAHAGTARQMRDLLGLEQVPNKNAYHYADYQARLKEDDARRQALAADWEAKNMIGEAA
ncbi:MAG: hypothetical protein AAF943_15800 [Pseudomonadota bacterium]